MFINIVCQKLENHHHVQHDRARHDRVRHEDRTDHKASFSETVLKDLARKDLVLRKVLEVRDDHNFVADSKEVKDKCLRMKWLKLLVLSS